MDQALTHAGPVLSLALYLLLGHSGRSFRQSFSPTALHVVNWRLFKPHCESACCGCLLLANNSYTVVRFGRVQLIYGGCYLPVISILCRKLLGVISEALDWSSKWVPVTTLSGRKATLASDIRKELSRLILGWHALCLSCCQAEIQPVKSRLQFRMSINFKSGNYLFAVPTSFLKCTNEWM